MRNAAFRTAPGQESIAQGQFNAFAFALDSSIQLIEVFENLYGQSCRAFIFRPLSVLRLPKIPAGNAIGFDIEFYEYGLAIGARLIFRMPNGWVLERIVPTRFQPGFELQTGVWRASQFWSGDFENKGL